MEKIRAIKGTHDILPDEVYKWQYVENEITKICNTYGFSEIRVPVLEYTDLFKRGVGDTTDVVQKEMYTFSDRGGRSLSLRPEGTAGVVRSFIEHSLYADTLPKKLYYILSCHRNENPQSGRFREFNQFGVEVFGAESPLADAEVISIAMNFLKNTGLKNISLNINSIGCRQCRARYNEILIAYLKNDAKELCGLCNERIEKNPLRVLDCKNEKCGQIAENAPRLLDFICDDCKEHFSRLKTLLNGMNIAFNVDGGIVRGLDYYTKTVFEIMSEDNLTVCGGGRYDKLVEMLGGPFVPGIGFGLGLERLIMCLEKQSAPIPLPPLCDIYIAPMGEAAEIFSAMLTDKLRQKGCRAETDVSKRSLKAQMKYADKIGAKYSCVIGDNELSGKGTEIKNMETGEKTYVKFEDFENWEM